MDERHLSQLPPVEQDVMRLSSVHGKSQIQIAQIMGVSQPTINYRIKHAKIRLQFLESLPAITSEEVRHVMGRLGAKPKMVETMLLYLDCRSQSEVARRTSRSQGAVRHWLVQTDKLLKSDRNPDEIHKRVRVACQLVIAKPNLFNDAQKTAHKMDDVILRVTSKPRIQGGILLDGVCSGLEGDDQGSQVVVRLKSRTVFIRFPQSV